MALPRRRQPACTVGGVRRPRNDTLTIGLLAGGFGLVGFDRFMILPMFPVLQRDLHLDYRDLGLITGALALSWGLCSILAGPLVRRIGIRRVVVGSIVLFSALAGVSGLATGLLSLVFLRVLMGVFEGGFTPAALVATVEASDPASQGRNIGVQQAALPLFGMAIAPLVVTQLLNVVDWRIIFALVTIPGLAVAWALARRLRPVPLAELALHTTVRDVVSHSWRDVFAYRNIPLNMIAMLCWLNALIVITAMLPSYMIAYLKLDLPSMGLALSGIGFGATAGDLIMLWLSDRIGRRTVGLIDVVGSVVFLALFAKAGPHVPTLFMLLFGTAFFLHNLIPLTAGPLSIEAVPPSLMTSATGLVIGVGEIFGGGVAPIIAGFVAHSYGIQAILPMAIAGLLLGLIVLMFVRETHDPTLRGK